MKTAIKITAIAVITVLAVLACSDGVELTHRDFKEIRDAKNPKYDNVTYSGYVPSFSSGGLTYVTSPNTPTETQREITITFPNSADILGKDITTAALKEFISIYTYTINTTPPIYTEVSTKESDVDFEFVRRVRNAIGYGEDVVIRLSTVPAKSFVVKIDATKYTFAKGLKLDYDGDNVAGEAVYDDVYSTITPSGAANTGYYTNPRLGFSLSIGVSPSVATLTAQDITVANLNLGSYSSASTKSQQKTIIEALIPKIKLQKYDAAAKTWTDVGTVKSVDSDPTSTTSGSWFLAVNATPQDGDIYRTYAAGMKNLTTADTYLGVKQKIRVSGGSWYGVSSSSYNYNTVISDLRTFSNPDRINQSSTPVDSSYPINVSSDASGKNVKLEIYFKSIDVTNSGPPPTTTTYWLRELNAETFKKNVKLVYNRSNSGSEISSLGSMTLGDLVFIPVKEVKYDSNNPKNLATAPGTNRITITLDPSYQISQGRNRTISLLLAPDFKYGSDLITFGNYPSSTNIIIDGTNCWRAYGKINSASSGDLKL